MSCAVCDFADVHGWWGQDGTHCRGCHRSWLSKREMHCNSCHCHFSVPENLWLHKTASGHCIPPGEVVGKDGQPKLKTKVGAGGPTWIGAKSRTDFPPRSQESLDVADSKPLKPSEVSSASSGHSDGA